MNENKFTPTAEEALRLAQEAAGELGHGYVGTEHLLLGLMREDEGMAHTVLTEAGLTDDLLTEMVRKSVGAGLPGGNPAQGLTPRAKHVVAHHGDNGSRCQKTPRNLLFTDCSLFLNKSLEFSRRNHIRFVLCRVSKRTYPAVY